MRELNSKKFSHWTNSSKVLIGWIRERGNFVVNHWKHSLSPFFFLSSFLTSHAYVEQNENKVNEINFIFVSANLFNIIVKKKKKKKASFVSSLKRKKKKKKTERNINLIILRERNGIHNSIMYFISPCRIFCVTLAIQLLALWSWKLYNYGSSVHEFMISMMERLKSGSTVFIMISHPNNTKKES